MASPQRRGLGANESIAQLKIMNIDRRESWRKKRTGVDEIYSRIGAD